MFSMIAKLDQDIGYMITELKEKRLFDELNIILTSDHGMTTMHANVYLDDYLNSSLYSWFGGSPDGNILPKDGTLLLRCDWKLLELEITLLIN